MWKLLDEIRVLMTRRDKVRMAVLVVLMVIAGGLEIVGISILMPVVAVLSKPELLEQNRYLHWVYRAVNPTGLREFLLILCAAVALFYVVKNLFILWMTHLQAKFIYDHAALWASRLYRNYLRTGYRFHLEHSSSELLNNINQLLIVTTGVLLPLMMLASECVVIAFLAGLLLIFAPVPTLAALAAMLLAAGAFYWPFKRFNYRLGQQQMEQARVIFQCEMQGIGGIKEVKVRNQEERFSRIHEEAQRRRYRAERLLYFAGQFPRLMLETLVVLLAMALLAVFAASRMASGTILLTVALLAMAMFRLLPAISRVQYNLVRIRQSLCSFDAVFRDLTCIEPEAVKAVEPPIQFREMLRVESVVFGYDPGRPPVLDGFTAEIPVRSSVALVGATGAGKTTLADLILGLLEPQAGRITVDGRDIRENLGSWRRLIGYVPQNIYLTDGSIRENVALGIPPEEIDEQRVRECIEMAQLTEFVDSLPEGLDTPAGERGIRMSGGQRQRIAIARALYCRPEVLVLDEATSALDTGTEQCLIDALNLLKGRLTILMIAHRLSTIEKCDRVIRL